MQPDALTAGIALIVVELCVAIIMTGIFYATPGEKCTRNWALGSFALGLGVLLLFLNAGAPRPALLLVANGSLILGMVWHWRGIRAFYKKPSAHIGWIIATFFFTLYCLALLQNRSVGERVVVISSAFVSMLALYFHEIRTGQCGHRSFASLVTLSAISVLGISHGLRAYFAAVHPAEALPESFLSILFTFMIPTGGTILLSFGLLLLYFERIVAEKHRLASHDDMTGVLNRRAIVAAGEREIAVAMRTRQPLAVAFVDIDFFKQINDRFGHEAGDRVLIETADVLVQTCRNIDMVGRYGGDEFCVILPGMNPDSLTAFGERLVNAVRQCGFSGSSSVTISVGLASLSDSGEEYSWDRLVASADNELYKAKAAGRNRYSVAAKDAKLAYSADLQNA